MEIVNRVTGVNLDLGPITWDKTQASLDWRGFDTFTRNHRNPTEKNPLDAGWTAVSIEATAVHG